MNNSDIPVFITYRDRREFLEKCLASLFGRGFTDVTVINNHSKDRIYVGTEPWAPVDALPYESLAIVDADNTYRQLAPWGLGLVPDDRYYIVMDCDIELDCPDDVGAHLIDLLERNPDVSHLGLSIRTDDFLDPAPARYQYSYERERAVESEFFLNFDRSIQYAPVDTHFAMYRPGAVWSGIGGARATAPYLCRHLPWYEADYSEDEKIYYARAGRNWAASHCAESLAPMKTIVPFTSLRAETVVGIANATDTEVSYKPILTDEDYFNYLAEAWDEGETFCVVEHDIVINEDTIQELRDCPHDWCVMPYPYLDNPAAIGLGVVKFRDRLIARNPGLFADIANCAGPGREHPAKHWCTLDYWIYQILAVQRGEVRHEGHIHLCGHIGGEKVAHGCM